MMMRLFVTATLLSVLAVSVQGQSASAPGATRNGYLTAETTPDVARIVPPAPQPGDLRFMADMEIYRATRSLEGSPRWTLAQSDDNVSAAGLFNAFSCSLSVTLTRENAPRTTALVARANADATRAAGLLKTLYGHKRPFQVEDGSVCLSPQGKTALERSPDYPSGHTTAAWEGGLLLAELAPEKSSDILARARAFGQSRVVCGVHNASAVEAGWMTATSIFTAQNGSPEFRADLESAQAELAELLKQPAVAPQSCSLERELIANRPY
jgi:acid phosphatase (class A)